MEVNRCIEFVLNVPNDKKIDKQLFKTCTYREDFSRYTNIEQMLRQTEQLILTGEHVYLYPGYISACKKTGYTKRSDLLAPIIYNAMRITHAPSRSFVEERQELFKDIFDLTQINKCGPTPEGLEFAKCLYTTRITYIDASKLMEIMKVEECDCTWHSPKDQEYYEKLFRLAGNSIRGVKEYSKIKNLNMAAYLELYLDETDYNTKSARSA